MSKSHFHPHGCHSVTWALPSKVVLPLSVVDNSAFSSNCLTNSIGSAYPSSK